MCPNGIITSSIMTAVCFTLSAPLVCLPFRNWACWLLSMRRVASPKARTTPSWRNCTADTQWVHTHIRKHTSFTCLLGETHKDIKMIHIPPPPTQLRQPKRAKPLPRPMNCLQFRVERPCSTRTRPRALSHANTTMLKCDQHCVQEKRVSSENPAGFSMADGKNRRGTKWDLRTGWPLPQVSEAYVEF